MFLLNMAYMSTSEVETIFVIYKIQENIYEISLNAYSIFSLDSNK